MKKETGLNCSFCGKSENDVKKLVAGPGVFVCDECISLCNEIMDENWSPNRIIDLQSFGPARQELSAPLDSVPKELITSTINCIESLIEAYTVAGKKDDAEPLYRVLLALQEHELGSLDVRLLPILEQLYKIYNRKNHNQTCSDSLSWMICIVDETKTTELDRTELLIKLAKLQIRLGKRDKAEEILDRIQSKPELK